MDTEFWKNFQKRLSVGETLYKRIIELMEIKGMTEKEFYDKTKLTHGYLSALKKKEKRREITTIITICIGMELEVNDSLDLIRLAGLQLISANSLEYAYMELICHYNEMGIDACNERLEELGFSSIHWLGSKGYNKDK